jgi:hypothetical protein
VLSIDPALLESLVWTDYRLAVLFTVFLPLVLLVWAFIRKSEAIQLLLTIYWKVASLLMITVYLMIGGFSIGFITGLMARILIPMTLWFWEDLNEEIREQPNSALRFAFVSWRWAVDGLQRQSGRSRCFSSYPAPFSPRAVLPASAAKPGYSRRCCTKGICTPTIPMASWASLACWGW